MSTTHSRRRSRRSSFPSLRDDRRNRWQPAAPSGHDAEPEQRHTLGPLVQVEVYIPLAVERERQADQDGGDAHDGGRGRRQAQQGAVTRIRWSDVSTPRVVSYERRARARSTTNGAMPTVMTAIHSPSMPTSAISRTAPPSIDAIASQTSGVMATASFTTSFGPRQDHATARPFSVVRWRCGGSSIPFHRPVTCMAMWPMTGASSEPVARKAMVSSPHPNITGRTWRLR